MRRFLMMLFVMLGVAGITADAAEDIIIMDFEGSDYGEWKAEGDAFGTAPAKGKIGDAIKLYLWPVKELENLYSKTHKIKTKKLGAENPLSEIKAEAFDMTLEFEPGSARQIKFQLRDVGMTYDASSGKLKGRFKDIQVNPIDGVCKLRVLIDTGSVEVFANEGEYVATTYVLSKPDNLDLSITATGGEAKVRKLTVSEIKGFWEE